MIGDKFIGQLIVPTGRAVVIVFILAVVGIGILKNSKSTLELDVDIAVTNILAFAIGRNKLDEFKTAAADCIERADLLGEVLANTLVLIADI